MTPAAAAGTAAIIGLASVVGRLSVGFLLDRLAPGLVATGVMTASAAGALALWQFGAPAAPISAALLGLAAGAEVDLIAFLTARYFGQRAYGAIYGWQYSVFAMGYGLSPFIVGRLRDVRGDYGLAILLCVGAMMLAMTAVQLLSRRSSKGEQFARTLA
jgi:predicted MFS family arabinose efflux permease